MSSRLWRKMADEAGNYLWELPRMPLVGLRVKPFHNSRKAKHKKHALALKWVD